MTSIAPYANLALTWVLFLALFPMGFLWLRRSWRILARRNYAEVALKRGVPPAQPRKYALVCGMLNLVAGLAVLYVIVGILLGRFDYDTWTAMAGITIWSKLFLDFAISRQAHGFGAGRKAPARSPGR